MANPTAAMLVIGDEILSGRTRDSNTALLAGALTTHGIDLQQVRIVGDQRKAIVPAVRELAQSHDHVFTSGGIGPTHDDITADCVAHAFGCAIGIREDARVLLRAHYAARGLPFSPARQRMARIPDKAVLIENPVSVAPGFSLFNVHVMAGVPKVFEAMVGALLPRLQGGTPWLSASLRVMRMESDIAGALNELVRAFPAVSIGSYPFQQGESYGVNVVVRGTEQQQIDQITAQLKARFHGAS
ncbi:MAG: competence/damage-inducible protein A [Rhodobacteraceae bacterium]|nr:competence/damage-inducible protein A [Paracoccaceae bacterium]